MKQPNPVAKGFKLGKKGKHRTSPHAAGMRLVCCGKGGQYIKSILYGYRQAADSAMGQRERIRLKAKCNLTV